MIKDGKVIEMQILGSLPWSEAGDSSQDFASQKGGGQSH